MDAIFQAKWLKSGEDMGEICPVFFKNFSLKKEVKSAALQVTGLCVYAAYINGCRAGNFVLAPGWTSYEHRVQYQTYDVTDLLAKNEEEQVIEIGAGKGWRFHRLAVDWFGAGKQLDVDEIAIIACLAVEYADGTKEIITTDASWNTRKSQTVYSNMYNGETFDATAVCDESFPVAVVDHPLNILISQEGEEIREKERFSGGRLIKTPKGETVIDFCQEITGYLEIKIEGKQGREIVIRHFEMLDRDGNVYTDNLRKAKQELRFVCDGKPHIYKPSYAFFGFRYIQIIGLDDVKPEDFTAVAVYSDMRRTGYFACSDPLLNKLHENILWGQRGNFLDVPTDCPQRDERLGWTGDAQAFVRVAALNYDVSKFFKKWLGDMRVDQTPEGGIPHVIPTMYWKDHSSTGWADAACICPWQVYLTYGDASILEENFDMMRRWVDYMAKRAKKEHIDENFKKSRNPYVWSGDNHFGDWLAVGVENDKSVNYTDKDLIATAFFANSTDILIKSGKILGRDVSAYETLYQNVVQAFKDEFMNADGTAKIRTQTACVLAITFNLTDDMAATCRQLAGIVRETNCLMTGFLGTPYLLHALDKAGETKLAYDLILRKQYPSWLYPVTMGATTMWERWNSLNPDGSFADVGMNSFNHYAYGAVGDWMYATMAGIQIDENAPGFRNILFKPVPDERLTFVRAAICTKYGEVKSEWHKIGDRVEYSFTVPASCTATAFVNGKEYVLQTGETMIRT
ncbi:MAG: glycoside hydrolase family 78 protein [Oscillospiraceae bacterium]|jgi:alpha-L-rhamnosidase|nr:glycoside hydrolase family 78 protein [Oscillospiraceae bacterium]